MGSNDRAEESPFIPAVSHFISLSLQFWKIKKRKLHQKFSTETQ